jgi:hypothetical protein
MSYIYKNTTSTIYLNPTSAVLSLSWQRHGATKGNTGKKVLRSGHPMKPRRRRAQLRQSRQFDRFHCQK